MQVPSQQIIEQDHAIIQPSSTVALSGPNERQRIDTIKAGHFSDWLGSHSTRIASLLILSATLWFFCYNSLAEVLHFHFAATYEISTVGVPIPGTYFNYSKVKQSQRYEFESQIAKEIKPYNDTNCKFAKIGGVALCQNILKKSNALVNIGSRQPDTFGCRVSNEYGIFNYYYGCGNEHFPVCGSPNNLASLNCVGEVSEKVGSKTYQTLQDILLQQKLTDEYKILKMTVEGKGTWSSLIPFPTYYFNRIDQLVLDFHVEDAAYWGYVDVFKTLSQFYYPVNLHMNNLFCYKDEQIETKTRKLEASVFQVTYARKELLQLVSDTRSFVQNQVNTKEYPGIDCQMPHEIPIDEPLPISVVETPASEASLHTLQADHTHLTEPQQDKTVGVHNKGQFFQLSKIKPEKRTEYHAYIASIFEPYNDTDCEYSRYGDAAGEGFIVCRNILKKSTALLNIGIIGRDKFGCELTTQFSIPNLQFDCTSKVKPYCRTNSNGNVFAEACIGQRSQSIGADGRTYYSLKDVIDSRKLNNKHIVVKIGIEGQQWSALRSLPLSYLQKIDQMIIQMHLYQSFAYFEGNLNILRGLSENFYPVNFHMNNNDCWREFTGKLSSSVFEVTLVNRELLRLYSSDRSYVLHDLNRPTNPDRKDCQVLPSLD